jgi:FkbM family methyltransferase
MQNFNDNPDSTEFFLWEYLQNAGRPIVLLGTGDGADKMLAVMKRYGLRPACFTATGDFGMKPDFRGYKVLTFAEVEKRYKNFIVLICFGSDKAEVIENICRIIGEHESYAPDLPVVTDFESGTEFEIYTPDYLLEHSESIEKARKLFARSPDSKNSLQVFDGWLEYRLSGKLDVLERISSPREELFGLLKLKNNDEYFVDAGAFKGDTVEEFLKITGSTETANFTKIIAIEPDIKNYTLLRRKFYALGSAIFAPTNAAAWNADETLTFSVKSGKAGNVLQGEKLDEHTGRVVQVKGVKIDTLCGEVDKPTFIKIDVEGAERQVIEGAKTVITRHRPKMLVSLYHRPQDMFELPLLLHSYCAGYKFALRKTRCIPGWEFQLVVTK